jgi:hypothetical protein
LKFINQLILRTKPFIENQLKSEDKITDDNELIRIIRILTERFRNILMDETLNISDGDKLIITEISSNLNLLNNELNESANIQKILELSKIVCEKLEQF